MNSPIMAETHRMRKRADQFQDRDWVESLQEPLDNRWETRQNEQIQLLEAQNKPLNSLYQEEKEPEVTVRLNWVIEQVAAKSSMQTKETDQMVKTRFESRKLKQVNHMHATTALKVVKENQKEKFEQIFAEEAARQSNREINLAINEIVPLSLVQIISNENEAMRITIDMTKQENLSGALSHYLKKMKHAAISPLLGPYQLIIYHNEKLENKLEAILCKKFNLVLDLDETLVSSRTVPPNAIPNVTKNEVKLWVRDINGNKQPCITRLRPGVEKMLRWAAPLFRIKIVTNGTRNYATEIVKILDPHRAHLLKYAYHSNYPLIMSREDMIHPQNIKTQMSGIKSLTNIGFHPARTVILDDDPSVWEDDAKLSLLPFEKICIEGSFNITTVEQYKTLLHHFTHTMRMQLWMKLIWLQQLYQLSKSVHHLSPLSCKH